MAKSIPKWFDVDHTGFSALRQGQPKAFILYELLANSFDQKAKNITISLRKDDPVRMSITVEDDSPFGFDDLSESYTLFKSGIKSNGRRGRFSLGLKFVLANCETARISSTKGTVIFDTQERRTVPTVQEKGTTFNGLLRITQQEAEKMVLDARLVIPPTGVTVTINKETLVERVPIKEFEATLPTIVYDEDGILRESIGTGTVQIFEPLEGEKAHIYEMGIPIMATGDKYHYNILQRVPVTMDRFAVSQQFLDTVRHIVAEQTLDQIQSKEEASQEWVRKAMAHPEASKELTKTVIEQRFGPEPLIVDARSKESNEQAKADGHTVITGKQMTVEEWANAKKHEVVVPTSQVYKPEVKTVPEDEWTAPMNKMSRMVRSIANRIYDLKKIKVEFETGSRRTVQTRFEGETFYFNHAVLSGEWYEQGLTENTLDAILSVLHAEGVRPSEVSARLAFDIINHWDFWNELINGKK